LLRAAANPNWLKGQDWMMDELKMRRSFLRLFALFVLLVGASFVLGSSDAFLRSPPLVFGPARPQHRHPPTPQKLTQSKEMYCHRQKRMKNAKMDTRK